MLHMHVEGKNYEELKTNALAALGMSFTEVGKIKNVNYADSMPDEAKSNEYKTEKSLVTPLVSSQMPEHILTEAKNRVRRTKAQIKADEEAAQNVSAHVAVATNEEEKSHIDVASLKKEEQDPLGEEAPTAKALTQTDCKEALRKVIATKGMDSAIAICKQFNIKLVTELTPAQFDKFFATCESVLK